MFKVKEKPPFIIPSLKELPTWVKPLLPRQTTSKRYTLKKVVYPLRSLMLQQKRLNSLFWYIATPIILVGLTILTYIPSLHYAFQFDDEPNILKAYEIRFLTLNDIFLSNSRWISKWISVWSYHFGKFEPFFYRCANVSFHVITGLIIYYFFFIGL